jgi:hypothetical protein
MGNGDLTKTSSSAAQAVHRVLFIEPCKPLIFDVEALQEQKTRMRQCTCRLLEVGGANLGGFTIASLSAAQATRTARHASSSRCQSRGQTPARGTPAVILLLPRDFHPLPSHPATHSSQSTWKTHTKASCKLSHGPSAVIPSAYISASDPCCTQGHCRHHTFPSTVARVPQVMYNGMYEDTDPWML